MVFHSWVRGWTSVRAFLYRTNCWVPLPQGQCIGFLQPVSKLSYLGEWSESRENVRGRRKESLQPSITNFHLYFAQTKGNTIGWKMMFRKSKLIDNRLNRHPLCLCVKFASQGDQIGIRQPRTRGIIFLFINHFASKQCFYMFFFPQGHRTSTCQLG